MAVEVKVPSVGESVSEAVLVQWLQNDGEIVAKDTPLFVIETDKITLEITADAGGRLEIKVPEGETVSIGTVVAMIDETESAPVESVENQTVTAEEEEPSPVKDPLGEEPIPPKFPSQETPVMKPLADLAPSVRLLVKEKRVDPADVTGSGPGGRITKADVMLHLESLPRQDAPASPLPGNGKDPAAVPAQADAKSGESVTREPMTPIRRRISQHLLAAKQNTAMLTTFNEIDMSRAMDLRKAYKESFQKKHGVSLGYMSFFTKACITALKEFPLVNAFIDGEDIVYHHYYHIGVAIGSGKGLVVPVIRNADRLGFAGIEQAIVDFVGKIESNRLNLGDLEGGTFTISNGGVYGSLLSTPILNAPQSGILGMHKIEKRPVVVDDAIVIRPMMYVALSYDHRIVDGREAVGFLKRIKTCVESPEQMFLEV